MKTIKFFMIVALCSAVISGCSDKSAAPPHLVAVPKDAALVLSLNAKQIVEKAELNKPEQYKCYSLLQQELQKEAGKDFVKDFLKDTRTSGLNLDNIFVYLMAGNNTTEDIGYGVVFLIDKLKTFEQFLEKNNLHSDTENRLVRFFDITLQWNDKIAIISRNVADSGVDIFNEDESQSILANELFKEEYSEKNDVYLFFKYNVIGEILKEYPHAKYATSSVQFSSMLDLYKDLSLSLKLNAEKGELVATGKMLPAEKAEELFEKFYKTDFDSNLYRYFPDKSLLAFKFAMKPLDVYNEYKKYFNNLANREVETLMERYDAKVTSVLSNFTGDCLGSLISFGANAVPDFAIAAGVVEGKENEVVKLMEGLGFVKKPEGYYSLGGGVNLYFAVNNNAAYLTGNATYITDFLNNTHYTANITAAKDFGREFEEALYYFYWDVNINNYPSILKSVLSMSAQGNMAMPLLEKLKSINVRTIGTNGSEFKVIFNDNEYASKTLLKAVDDLIFQYLN
jgi:hypothetical protein